MARDSLPAWCRQLLADFNDSDARAASIVKGLTREQLNWKRSPAEWSVGQCLEHLAIGNEVYLRPMSDALRGRSRAVVSEIRPGWLGRWFIRTYIEPSGRTKRARAPRKIAPASHAELDVVDRLLRSNERLREFAMQASDYDVNRIRFRNPFVPLIRFTVGTGLLLLAAHERRHLLQAERIKASMPPSGA
jgi:DinB family protein